MQKTNGIKAGLTWGTEEGVPCWRLPATEGREVAEITGLCVGGDSFPGQAPEHSPVGGTAQGESPAGSDISSQMFVCWPEGSPLRRVHRSAQVYPTTPWELSEPSSHLVIPLLIQVAGLDSAVSSLGLLLPWL